MTAVDLDALDKLRGALALWLEARGEPISETEPARHWLPVADALIAGPLADLIAEARKYRALREAVEGLAERYDRPATPDGMRALYGGGQVCYDLRAVVAALDPT